MHLDIVLNDTYNERIVLLLMMMIDMDFFVRKKKLKLLKLAEMFARSMNNCIIMRLIRKNSHFHFVI